MPAFTSSYAADGSKDDGTSLVSGIDTFTTTLTVELDAANARQIVVDDDIRTLPRQGIVVIEDEIIYYKDHEDPYWLLYLTRGYAGTTPATHALGATVTFYPMPKFINPALTEAILAMQDKLIEYEERIATLEGA